MWASVDRWKLPKYLMPCVIASCAAQFLLIWIFKALYNRSSHPKCTFFIFYFFIDNKWRSVHSQFHSWKLKLTFIHCATMSPENYSVNWQVIVVAFIVHNVLVSDRGIFFFFFGSFIGIGESDDSGVIDGSKQLMGPSVTLTNRFPSKWIDHITLNEDAYYRQFYPWDWFFNTKSTDKLIRLR